MPDEDDWHDATSMSDAHEVQFNPTTRQWRHRRTSIPPAFDRSGEANLGRAYPDLAWTPGRPPA